MFKAPPHEKGEKERFERQTHKIAWAGDPAVKVIAFT